TSDLAVKTDLVLRDNYRSVLAAQRMKESVERIDSGTVFWILGHRDQARQQTAENEANFERELRVEEGNITEAGEADAAAILRDRWRDYLGKARAFEKVPDDRQVATYFADLAPAFLRVKESTDTVLALNQDAIVRKSDQAIRSAARARSAIVGVA